MYFPCCSQPVIEWHKLILWFNEASPFYFSHLWVEHAVRSKVRLLLLLWLTYLPTAYRSPSYRYTSLSAICCPVFSSLGLRHTEVQAWSQSLSAQLPVTLPFGQKATLPSPVNWVLLSQTRWSAESHTHRMFAIWKEVKLLCSKAGSCLFSV